MKTVIFACVHNAGPLADGGGVVQPRSPIRRRPAPSRRARSPGARVHPEVVRHARGRHRSRGAHAATLTRGARARARSCWSRWAAATSAPVVPGARARRLAAARPEGQGPVEVREIRDDIRDASRGSSNGRDGRDWWAGWVAGLLKENHRKTHRATQPTLSYCSYPATQLFFFFKKKNLPKN